MKFQQKVSLQFETGVTTEIDISHVKMNENQRLIVEKLFREVSGHAMRAVGCPTNLTEAEQEKVAPAPALQFLPREEFEQIRHLKARLGPDGSDVAAGIIIDFCIHAVVVDEQFVAERLRSNPAPQ